MHRKTTTTFYILAWALCALLVTPLASAQPFANGPTVENDAADVFTPNLLPALNLTHIATPIKIDGYIARTRVGYQFTRKFFMRTVVQYNDFSESLEIDPLITYKINAFTALHVGSTHDFDRFDHPGQPDDPSRFFRQSSRQFFFKFQYLFRT